MTEAIDLSKLTEEIAHLLEASISKKVSLHHEFEPHLPLVEADPAQLQQIVMNLITNASDAIGDEPGVIALRTRAVDVGPDTLDGTYVHDALSEGRHVALEVSDTGVGMDEETRARVFDPFFTTKFAGRGLGLAAVLGIVRGHHGAIRVQSAPGRGTTITILLPALDADETLPELRRGDRGEEGIGSWQASGTILIADDEEDVREVAKQTLEEYGFDVLTAQDGREAVEVFRAHAGQIDAVLLDMTMPVMGGEEAYRAICEISPRVPVVLSSGFSETEVTGRFGRGEPLTFIQKPFVPSELAATIRSVIEVRPAE